MYVCVCVCVCAYDVLVRRVCIQVHPDTCVFMRIINTMIII